MSPYTLLPCHYFLSMMPCCHADVIFFTCCVTERPSPAADMPLCYTPPLRHAFTAPMLMRALRFDDA